MMHAIGLLILLLLVAGCTSHPAGQQEAVWEPFSSFSGRLLVLNPKHRLQFEVDWQGDEQQGDLRITHIASGRIVYVKWQDEAMLMLDAQKSSVWHALSEAALLDIGVMLPPWILARIFLGDLPETMLAKGDRVWKGVWGDAYLHVRWASDYGRVELLDMQRGRKVVLVFDEVRR